MSAVTVAAVVAGLLVALGLVVAVRQRHTTAAVVGGQLGAIGAVLGVVALVGPAGADLGALVALLTGLAGILFLTLQDLDDQDPGAGDHDEEDVDAQALDGRGVPPSADAGPPDVPPDLPGAPS